MQDSFDSRLAWLEQPDAAKLARGGLRGVEKESLRVTAEGRLARTAHPAALGSALTHAALTTDFSEALLEFVTPPFASNWETLQTLCDLHVFVQQSIGDELLWPASMPCALAAGEEVPIADYGSSNAGRMRSVYRSGLGYRYGRAMQAIAGAHFNFSMPADFWPAFQAHSRARGPEAGFRSESLMALVRNFRRYGCLIIYLCGESPAFCKSFNPAGHELLSELDPATWHAPHATSLRMSDIGYRNRSQARLNISANSLDDYVAGLTAAISTEEPAYAEIGVVDARGEYRQLNANVLQIENEYYTSIRPKPADRGIRPTRALARDGVEYVEVRTLDLSLSDPVGISQSRMRLVEALLIYCLLEPSPPIGAAEQDEINARDLIVARRGREPGLTLPVHGREQAFRAFGRRVLERVAAVAGVLDAHDEGYVAAAAEALAMLDAPETTPSARLLAELQRSGASFFEYGLDVARRHRDYLLGLQLPPDVAQRLQREAEASLADAAALEAAPAPTFAEYLDAYFAA